LRALARSGNVGLAALEAGFDKSSAYYHRKRERDFARRWDAAKAKGKAAAATGKRARQGKIAVELVLRNGKDGPKYVRAAMGRWNDDVEAVFLAALERTGCIRWAAAAAGFSTRTIYYRRAHYPDFAERCDAAEARARQRIPAILTAATIATFDPEIDGESLPPVSIDQAIAIARLKCSSGGAGAGGGPRGGYIRREPSIEEVRDEVIRRIAAIRRHREQGGGGEEEQPPLPGGEDT
jgi:hypothetical protein